MKKATPKHEGMKRILGHRFFAGAADLGSKMNFSGLDKHYRRLFKKGSKTE